MITFTPEHLPSAAEESFRDWLRKPQIETLVRVVRAKQQAAECTALRDAVVAGRYTAKLESANEHLQIAQRYQACLDVLKEIVEQQTPYQTAKLT